ncbi:hypothetical protein [Arcanobacterium buesumense]|uniref:Uncharacterized protein n=1 Tax=Arcanobacterium buesumense TaxID=2722751 RepID=A0A6H2END4_9ACTO|nr:hypothetical protein [Arcanobacterium buesumense]QJC22581.1 hypothetical protein HC352_08770 [Arcanobacterium buesumense]
MQHRKNCQYSGKRCAVTRDTKIAIVFLIVGALCFTAMILLRNYAGFIAIVSAVFMVGAVLYAATTSKTALPTSWLLVIAGYGIVLGSLAAYLLLVPGR